jgi:hypothetical protein
MDHASSKLGLHLGNQYVEPQVPISVGDNMAADQFLPTNKGFYCNVE